MDQSQCLRARVKAAFWLCVGLCSAAAHADVVTTVDGARLTGTINKITPKVVELKTSYAGTLMVDMAQIASVTSDAPLTTQFKDSTTVTGVTVIDQQSIHVTSDTVASTTSLEPAAGDVGAERRTAAGVTVRPAALGVRRRRRHRRQDRVTPTK